ncbi:MAG TPA: hypothetical protein VFJ64_02945 [Solirubrobacterales bacterium]|nr:hypothetical protein [Solirubrobacterales bacterium]
MQRRKQAILAAAAAVAIGVVALLAVLAFRPALVLGVDGGTLAHSVDSKLPSIGDPGHCQRGTNGDWLCHLLFEQDPGSGGGYVAYEVTADRFGCWRATRPNGSRSGDKLPAVTHGCIYLWDF